MSNSDEKSLLQKDMTDNKKSQKKQSFINNGFDYVWLIFIIILIILQYPIQGILQVERQILTEQGQTENLELNQKFFDVEDFQISFFLFLVIHSSDYLFNYLFHDIFYKICKEKKDEKLRKIRTQKAISQCQKCIFYIIDSSFVIYNFRNSPILPWYMGGSGQNIDEQMQGFYLVPPSQSLRQYYCLQLAYHYNSIALIFVGKLKKDGFLEMTAHHLICIMLIQMNVMTNRLQAVLGIIYCCSVTDIFMSIIRTLAETQFGTIGGVLAVFLLIPVWFYYRLIAYPSNLIEIREYVYNFNDKIQKPNSLDNVYFTLLGMIFILSIYWFYLIIKSTKNYIIKGIIQDSQDYKVNKKQY